MNLQLYKLKWRCSGSLSPSLDLNWKYYDLHLGFVQVCTVLFGSGFDIHMMSYLWDT